MKNKKVLIITQVGLYIALIFAVQFFSKSFGQLATGSLVNALLILAGATAGLIPALCVALISPILAFLNGIGPAVVQIIPFIAVGNMIIVLITYYGFKNSGDLTKFKDYIFAIGGILTGAVFKYLVLWLGITKLLFAIDASFKPQQVTTLTAAFSISQLITALIGGAIAIILAVPIRKALQKSK